MNTQSKPGKSVKRQPGRPRNESSLETISVYPPPLPPAPVLSRIQPAETISVSPSYSREDRYTSPAIRSPVDQTPIVVNGKVIDIEAEMEERIHGKSPIVKPATPPRQPIELPNYQSEEKRTPPSLPISDVNIIETPEASPEVSPHLPPPEPPKTFTIPSPKDVRVETLPNKPLNFTSILEESNSPESKSSSDTYITESSEETPAPEPETKFEGFNNIFPKQSEQSEDEESEEEEDDESKPFPLPFFGDANPSVPMISGRIRADSPIETIGGPSSPNAMNLSKPMFTSEGKSYTPRRVSSPVQPKISPKVINSIHDNKVPSVRNVIHPSPKHNSRVPSPIRPGQSPSPRGHSPRPITPRLQSHSQPQPQAVQQIQGPSMFFPPQSGQQGSIFGGRPDYSKLTPDQQVYMRSEFRVKFGILRSSYPQWNVIEPSDALTIDQIHDIYEYYIRQILVSKETGQYKVYLVLFFMFIEVIGVRILKLNMSGYTMSQLRIMNRYDTLLAELGEKWLVSSGSEWSVEARLLMMGVFNAVIFLAVRYLCSWMGVETLSDTIQNLIDNMLNGPDAHKQHSYPGQVNSPPTPTPENVQPQGNPLDGIASAFSGLFGGNKGIDTSGLTGGLTDGIAKLGTMFTNKMQQANKAQASQPAPKPNPKPVVKGRINKKTLFG